MKRFSEQFHKAAQSVSMQASEREALKARVVSYIEYHPVTAAQKAIPSPLVDSFKVVALPRLWFTRFTAVVAVFLIMVIPVLAEQSVPGESLYAVKVRFNEEVRSTLTFNQQERVEWETERLNRRIADARLLASKGELTDEVQAEVAAAVREHTETVKEEIAELREDDVDGATFASIELTTTLELQSTSLQQDDTVAMATQSTTDASPTQKLVDVLNETLSQQDQTDSSPIPSYDKIVARIEQNTTRSYELFNSIAFAEGDPINAGLDRRLQDISRSIDEANALRPQDEAAASQLLIDTLERTQKLIVYMSDVEVNRAVALDTVVPVILTPEERQSQLALLDTEINRKVEILETVHSQLNTEVAEKVDYSIRVAKEKQEEVHATTTNLDAGIYAKDTIALLDDALKVVSDSGVSISATATSSVDTTATSTATSSPDTSTSNE